MPYTPTQWNDKTAPAISAENLNKIEKGLESASSIADAATASADAATKSAADANTSVAAVKKTADAALPATSAAVSAAKWTTARKVTITGAAEGEATVDGSKDIVIDLNLKSATNVADIPSDADLATAVSKVNALLKSLRDASVLK